MIRPLLTKEHARDIQRAVNSLVNAEVKASWKGTLTPEGAARAESAVKRARARFKEVLASYTIPSDTTS